MIHVMKLKEQYFNYIKYGTKKYEIRLYDEKRKNIKKGDFIEFQKEPLLEEKFIVMVEDILLYRNFDQLLSDIDIEFLSDSTSSKKKLLSDLEKFYPLEKQKKYGVVAIQLNKNIMIHHSDINQISFDDEMFDILKSNYDIDSWINKMKDSHIDVYYTEKDYNLSSILILKINETDSQQFLKTGKILKIRTLLVKDKEKGIGGRYLSLVDEIAKSNQIDYIYLTTKQDNLKFISFIKQNGYQKYGSYYNEFVYYKELK